MLALLQPIQVSVRALTALALPTDVISPCVGFFCALVGSRMPPMLLASLTSTFTSTRSPTGATVLYCRRHNHSLCQPKRGGVQTPFLDKLAGGVTLTTLRRQRRAQLSSTHTTRRQRLSAVNATPCR